MSLTDDYKKEEAEAIKAAEALVSRISELEMLLVAAQQEISALNTRPMTVVKSDLVEVDFSPVFRAIADLKAQVASIPAPVASAGGGGSDSANWDKLWTALATIMAKMSKFDAFVNSVQSKFGI